MYSVIGYKKINNIFLNFGNFTKIEFAFERAENLKKGNKSIDSIEIFENWDTAAEKLIWASYEKNIVPQLFTSYYAQIRKFPKHMIPISISQGIPQWYDGLIYKKLAPLWSTVSTYKDNVSKDQTYWENWYKEQYYETVLNKLDPIQVAKELQSMVGDGNIPVLLCYEKTSDFCHRALVADWFNKANLLIREAVNNDFIEKTQESLLEDDLSR